MNIEQSPVHEIARLRQIWFAWLLFLSALAFGGFLLLGDAWDFANRLGWLALSYGLAIIQLLFLWGHLADNVRSRGGGFLPRLGLANWISLSRGALITLLAGFIAGPMPSGWLKWAPATLYLTAILLDYVDGTVARISRTETRLGEWLDMFLDGQAVLFACILIVIYGQAPIWYLLVGLARYLYLAGEWLYRRNRWTLHPLPPNPFRRALAGSQMGFIAVLLFPVFSPPVTTVAATLFMIPFLANFLRDWLWVSGVIPLPGDLKTPRHHWWNTILPVALRVVLAGLLIERMILLLSIGPMIAWPLLVVEALMVCSVLLGVLPRLAAVIGMLLGGFLLLENSLVWQSWLILLISMALFLLGSGRFSLWKPEEWIIHHRPGELEDLEKS